MPYKDIVVHVDDAKSSDTRLGVAIAMAKAGDGHLAAVYVKPTAYLPAYVAAQVGAEVMEAHTKAATEAAERAEAHAEEIADKVGVRLEWRVAEGAIEEAVALHARYADLSVIGQSDPDGETASDVVDVPGHVLLYSGRPVLVVPYVGRFDKVGDQVLIAWNGSREAARAVNDALPVLRNASKVTVLAVNPEHGPDQHGDLPGADISLHLARHGVKAEAAQVFANDVDVGDMLLSRAADMGIDLIVMGGYGRSRLRELVMGGASRHILQHMTVPALMAH